MTDEPTPEQIDSEAITLKIIAINQTENDCAIEAHSTDNQGAWQGLIKLHTTRPTAVRIGQTVTVTVDP